MFGMAGAFEEPTTREGPGQGPDPPLTHLYWSEPRPQAAHSLVTSGVVSAIQAKRRDVS